LPMRCQRFVVLMRTVVGSRWECPLDDAGVGLKLVKLVKLE